MHCFMNMDRLEGPSGTRAAKNQTMTESVRLVSGDGPLLVFGGPYSNHEATQAILDQALRLRVPPERTICTGDVVAYGADPAATVALIRASGCHVVMGNCEESLAQGAGDCGCGFPAGSTCDRLASAWFSYAASELSTDACSWMARLPRRLDVEIGGHRLAVVHGGVERINRFLFASTAEAFKKEELDRAAVGGLIAGHCGLPFTQSISGRLWHNAGAIGMPANDGTTRVWYSLLLPEKDGIAIEHHALAYDHNSAAAKMRRVGLPEEYAAALETGFWPSCDVLPLKEIRERGVRLQESRVMWQPAPAAEGRGRGRPQTRQLWPAVERDSVVRLDPRKFRDPDITADGRPRAHISLQHLKTLWFNTGTLCNIACRNCYIESGPKNDRFVYLKRREVAAYLDEIARDHWRTEEIGFTGGEPFMNPEFLDMLEDSLSRGFHVLVLTNAMRPMQRGKSRLLDIQKRLGEQLTIRVSLDHFTAERHEDERGPGTFKPTLDGLTWLARSGFNVAVAGRTMWGDEPDVQRAGYARLFAEHEIPIDAYDPDALVLFPEMDPMADVPEVTTSSCNSLGKSSTDVMCASSRMVVKRKGCDRPTVLACTLIPYDERFELGSTLADSRRSVSLNHPNCARFCVFGGASCSPGPAARGSTGAAPRFESVT